MGNLAELAFRRHYGDVYRFVRRRSSSWADAGDVTAEVFADAAKALDRFEPGTTPVLAWPVAAAVALLLVAPWQGRGPSVVDRALAVVGSGPVIHAVLEQPSPAVTVNLATGEEQALVSRVELWYSEQPRELRRRVTVAGELASDFLSTHGFMSLPDPALTEFATGYRAALAEGRAHVVGDVEVDGRRAKRIEFARSRRRCRNGDGRRRDIRSAHGLHDDSRRISDAGAARRDHRVPAVRRVGLRDAQFVDATALRGRDRCADQGAGPSGRQRAASVALIVRELSRESRIRQ